MSNLTTYHTELLQRLGRRIKSVNLFCGGGGVSAAQHETKVIDEVLAIDNDSAVEKVFRHNFHTVDFWNTDIGALGENDILRRTLLQKSELDILVSTSPCPAFSTAKGYINPLDESAWLFINGIDQIVNTMPKSGFLENVPGMDDPRATPIFNEIKRQIQEKLKPHYHIRCFELKASYFNVPQIRRRYIWIFYRKDLDVVPTHPKPNFAGQEHLRIIDVAPDIAAIKVGQSRKTLKSSNLAIMNTITASEGGMVVYRNDGRKDKLTIEELLRFATFPDWYTIPEGISHTIAHMVIGNCVPVKLAQAIIEHILLEVGFKF